MKKTILSAAIAATLAAAALVTAAAPAPEPIAPPQSPIESDLLNAVVAASNEMRAVYSSENDAVKILDALVRFEYSPELRSKLQAVFGSEKPLRLKRVGAAKGQINYAAVLLPHLYHEQENDVEWSALNVKIAAGSNGRTLAASGTWPQLKIRRTASPAGDVATFSDISFSSKMARGADTLWYGVSQTRVGHIVFNEVKLNAEAHVDSPLTGQQQVAVATAPDLTLRMDDLRGQASLQPHGKLADLGYLFSIGSIGIGGQKVERLTTNVRVTNIDAEAMVAFRKASESLGVAGRTTDQQSQAMIALLKDFSKNQVKQGASIQIDEISGRYHGSTASLKGRLDFDKVVDADFDNPQELVRKIHGRFEVRLPLPLLMDITRAVASASAPLVNGKKASEGYIDKIGNDVNMLAMAQLVGEGYARVEQGELRISLEFKDGKLTAGSKTIDISGLMALAQPQPHAQP